MTRHKSQQERRTQILAAARRCFVERGYSHSRMDDIAQSAELSKGGLYFHFTSKRQLFDALVDEEYERAMTALRNITKGPGTATEKLGGLALIYLREFSAQPDVTRFVMVVGGMALEDEALRDRVRTLHRQFLDSLAELIEAGIATGELRDIDARVAALYLKAIIDGLERHFAVGETFDLEALVGTGIDLVMHGLSGAKHGLDR